MCTIIPDSHPSADTPLGDVAELNARRIAAAAFLGDYKAELASAALGSPPGREWMLRLASVLEDLLAVLGGPDDEDDEDQDQATRTTLTRTAPGAAPASASSSATATPGCTTPARARRPARSSCTTRVTSPRSPGVRRGCPVTGLQYWKEADQILSGERCDYGCPHAGCEHEMAYLARAQVHATLALAAAAEDTRRLNEIRELLSRFDWEHDERQHALEAIERIREGESDAR
jgi:hypothetical protein